MQFTVQTRLSPDATTASGFDTLGAQHGVLLRSLYAEMARNGGKALDYKTAFCAKHHITARTFNALRVEVQGAIDSVRELLKAQAQDLSRQIARLKTKLKASGKRLDQHKAKALKLTPQRLESERRAHHHRQRALNKKTQKLAAVKQRLAAPVPGIAFGTRKLFRQQWHADSAPFKDAAEWKAAWRAARSHQVFFLGAKDETGGNQSCVARLQEDGTWHLQVRRFDRNLTGADRYLNLTGIRFLHGHGQLAAAFANGQALSYRFHRDERGWRVFVSFEVAARDLVTMSPLCGAVGVDFNQTHLSVATVDAYGNPAHLRDMDFAAGTDGAQRDRLANVIRELVIDCARQKLPLVVEDLDFAVLKRRLSAEGASAERQVKLSGLQYAQYRAQVERQCARHGVRLIKVAPAYTSVAGRLKYASRLGVSVHQAAALVIGRRGQQRKERVPRAGPLAVSGMAAALPFVVPVWKATEIGEARWARLSALLRVHRRQCWKATRARILPSGSAGNCRSVVGRSRAPRVGTVVRPAESSPLTW
jgi:IS605 OrfB family transposase